MSRVQPASPRTQSARERILGPGTRRSYALVKSATALATLAFALSLAGCGQAGVPATPTMSAATASASSEELAGLAAIIKQGRGDMKAVVAAWGR